MISGQRNTILTMGLLFISLVLPLFIPAGLASELNRREEIAFRHVVYEQFQTNYREAYLVAEYYAGRELGSDSILLAQAAASFELGYLELGRELISELDENLLLPENQLRLRLYLARDAYRRRDWLLLEAHLQHLNSTFSDDAFADDEYLNHRLFLEAELKRQQHKFAEAEQYLAQLDDQIDDQTNLARYGRFNLAVTLLVNSEAQWAIDLLQRATAMQTSTLEQLLLADRAKVALAEIFLIQNQPESAKEVLVSVSVAHEFGPVALAQLARIETEAQRYAAAAPIWQYLLEEYPWHRASAGAFGGLGLSIEMSSGEESALPVYMSRIKKVKAQQTQLAVFSSTIDEHIARPEDIVTGQTELLLTLSDGFGRKDWLHWLASHEVRQIAQRWQGLAYARKNLTETRGDLKALLLIDVEQQRRAKNGKEKIATTGLAEQLVELTAALEQRRRSFEVTFAYDDDIEQFATAEQLDALAFIQSIRSDYSGFLNRNVEEKLKRLTGKVRFDIFRDIPRVKQAKIVVLNENLVQSEEARQRQQRIETAASQRSDSVSQRLNNLLAQSAELQRETELALGATKHQLLTSVERIIDEDQQILENQVSALQFDLTRLADKRLATGGQQ